MTAKYNFKINQGSDLQKKITFKDASGTVQVLTGYTVAMQIRPVPSSQTVIDTLTTANGRITMAQDNKSITLLFPHEKTSTYVAPLSNIDLGTLPSVHYDIELTSSGGYVKRVLQGKIFISEETTRV